MKIERLSKLASSELKCAQPDSEPFSLPGFGGQRFLKLRLFSSSDGNGCPWNPWHNTSREGGDLVQG